MQPIRIKLDLNKEPQQFDVIHVRQGEFNAVTIEAEVYDNGADVDLSGYVVRFECKHVDGKMHEDNEQLTVSGNLITYKVHENVGAVAGMIETAYFSLQVENEDGSKELYATTQTFYFDVLPNACQDTAGITKAYSSQIEQMIRYCHDTFTENEANRQSEFDTNEAARQEASEAATERANVAAAKVEEALGGGMSDIFDDYIDSKKDVEGGLVSHEQHQIDIANAGTPDEETIGKNDDKQLFVKENSLGNRHLVDYSIQYEKLRNIPFPFNTTATLENIDSRCGSIVNAGAGWNTHKFFVPFEGVPIVLSRTEDGYAVSVSNVTNEGFLYKVTVGESSIAPVKNTYYVLSSDSLSSNIKGVSLVTDLVVGGAASTGNPVVIDYMAFYYGGD